MNVSYPYFFPYSSDLRFCIRCLFPSPTQTCGSLKALGIYWRVLPGKCWETSLRTSLPLLLSTSQDFLKPEKVTEMVFFWSWCLIVFDDIWVTHIQYELVITCLYSMPLSKAEIILFATTTIIISTIANACLNIMNV